MTEGETKAAFSKGERAAIVAGARDVGVRGEVFWIGENKYGPGMRYGLRGDDGATYWVDEAHLGAEEGAPPAPKPTASSSPRLEKGDAVEIVGGRDAGKRGEVFWVGESKYGKGMRYGVRGADDEETYWVDEGQVVRVEGSSDGSAAADDVRPPPVVDAPADDAPPPTDDDYVFPDEDEIPF
jgi:hypothetical protein